jgi:cation:H+ antiporter
VALDLLLFAAGLAALWGGAEWLVGGSARLAASFGVRPVIIGLTLVAFGTSAPEVVVTGIASARDQADLALGNVIGSNIANIALILGLAAVLRPIRAESSLVRRDIPVMILFGAVVPVLALIGVVSRPLAVLVLALFAGYLLHLWRSSRAAAPVPLPEPGEARRGRDTLLVVAGTALLALGAHLLVTGATAIARDLGVPEAAIGVSLVAFGTSVPEMAASVVAALRGQADLVLGNVVGSNIFNVTLVLGAAALVRPLPVSPELLRLEIPAMLVFSLLLLPLAFTQLRVDRWEGGLLLAGIRGLPLPRLLTESGRPRRAAGDAGGVHGEAAVQRLELRRRLLPLLGGGSGLRLPHAVGLGGLLLAAGEEECEQEGGDGTAVTHGGSSLRWGPPGAARNWRASGATRVPGFQTMKLPAPILLGHRGSPSRAPENSLAGLRLALEEGAHGVEFDVRGLSDGTPVVVHDDTFSRTHGRELRVADATLDDLGPLAETPGGAVSTLEEVTRWAAETGAWLNIELKEDHLEEATVSAVREAGIGDRTFVSSFLPEVVGRLRRLDPRLGRFFLTKRWTAAEEREARLIQPHGICLERGCAVPGVVQRIHELGMEVVAWTVNDPREAKGMFEMGVSAIITNDPAGLAHLVPDSVPAAPE